MRNTKEQDAFFRNIADRFVCTLPTDQDGQRPPYAAADAVDWARANEGLRLSPHEERGILIARMSESLRNHVVKDDQGRTVRLRHCVTVPRTQEREECTLWAHIDDARDEFLVHSLRQRRRRISADVEQLRADLDFINERRVNRGLRPIQMTIDDYRPSATEDDSAA